MENQTGICHNCKHAWIYSQSNVPNGVMCTMLNTAWSVFDVTACNRYEMDDETKKLVEEGKMVADAHAKGTLTVTGNDKSKKYKVPKL